ncbi:hypothetical protein D3C71_1681440 [compost metagenome]
MLRPGTHVFRGEEQLVVGAEHSEPFAVTNDHVVLVAIREFQSGYRIRVPHADIALSRFTPEDPIEVLDDPRLTGPVRPQ